MKDPKELDDPQLFDDPQPFDDPQLFDDQLEVWTLIIQKSTVIPSSPMVLLFSQCTIETSRLVQFNFFGISKIATQFYDAFDR